MLDILEGYLFQKGIGFSRLDGSTSRENRDNEISSFNSRVTLSADNIAQPNLPVSVFLLSTRAGGVGINLQSADIVILFDSDWNPQQDLQAISRAHRIGQKKIVLVLRFISEGPDDITYSVEQKILRRANKKLDASRKIMPDGEFNMGTISLNEDDSDFIGTENQAMISALFQSKSEDTKAFDFLDNTVHNEETCDCTNDSIYQLCRKQELKLDEKELNKIRALNSLNVEHKDNIDILEWGDWLANNIISDSNESENFPVLDEGQYKQHKIRKRAHKNNSLNENMMWKNVKYFA
jgi:superfamily II DNA or RNA helicase